MSDFSPFLSHAQEYVNSNHQIQSYIIPVR